MKQAAINDAISVRYNNQVYELKVAGKNPIVLSLGEAYFNFLNLPQEIPFLDEEVHYTHSRGTLALRQCVADFYHERYKVSCSAKDGVIISAGSKILTFIAINSVIRQSERKEVIIPQPAWVSYSEQVKISGGEVKFIPPKTSIATYVDYITENTKIIILCNPHNPTGYNAKKEELELLMKIARKRDIVIIADEAYSEFVLPEDPFHSFGNVDPGLERTIIVNSISKNFGMSGWRIGFAISNPGFIDDIYKFNQHLITCAPSALEHYCIRNFNSLFHNAKPQAIDVVKKRLKVENILNKYRIDYFAGTSTFYFFIYLKGWVTGSISFADLLLSEYGVVVVPGLGYGPDCDSYIRISIGSEPLERIEDGIGAIAKLLRH